MKKLYLRLLLFISYNSNIINILIRLIIPLLYFVYSSSHAFCMMSEDDFYTAQHVARANVLRDMIVIERDRDNLEYLVNVLRKYKTLGNFGVKGPEPFAGLPLVEVEQTEVIINKTSWWKSLILYLIVLILGTCLMDVIRIQIFEGTTVNDLKREALTIAQLFADNPDRYYEPLRKLTNYLSNISDSE